jgi:hypothetical protein
MKAHKLEREAAVQYITNTLLLGVEAIKPYKCTKWLSCRPARRRSCKKADINASLATTGLDWEVT